MTTEIQHIIYISSAYNMRTTLKMFAAKFPPIETECSTCGTKWRKFKFEN